MEIKIIKTNKDLSKVILFLQNYFNWSKEKSWKIKNRLIINNNSLGIYGYMLVDNKNILNGAFLVFFQGYKVNEYKKIKLLNMSSWYVVKKARGLYSLLMIKKMLNDFPEYSITNVSSNKKAYKILKALGFKDSKFINRKYNLLNFILNNRFLYKTNFPYVFNSRSSMISELPIEFFNNYYDCRLFKLGKSELKVITAKSNVERKLGFINIKIRGIRILWVSDPKIFSMFFYRILLFYFIRNISFFVTTHCELYDSKIKPIGESPQIYFSNNILLKNKNIALGSELSFF
tara:strand:- start:998 stop:1864 length:867 start_codon:yes stop_codon:yes gene_type:complete